MLERTVFRCPELEDRVLVGHEVDVGLFQAVRGEEALGFLSGAADASRRSPAAMSITTAADTPADRLQSAPHR